MYRLQKQVRKIEIYQKTCKLGKKKNVFQALNGLNAIFSILVFEVP